MTLGLTNISDIAATASKFVEHKWSQISGNFGLKRKEISIFFLDEKTISILQNGSCSLITLSKRFLISKECLPKYSKEKMSENQWNRFLFICSDVALQYLR